MAKGRRKKGGDRYPCGKLRPVRDGGNDRVRAHREPYLVHGQVKASDDLDCALGQAHAAGLLEGTDVDGRVLLEHGREWHRLHRSQFGGGVRTVNFERVDRSAPDLAVNGSDLRYRHWSRIVARLGAAERRVLRLTCIEHGDGWALPLFLERLVNGWKARQRPSLYAGSELPIEADHEALEQLKSALLALVGGRRHRDPNGAVNPRPIVSATFTSPA